MNSTSRRRTHNQDLLPTSVPQQPNGQQQPFDTNANRKSQKHSDDGKSGSSGDDDDDDEDDESKSAKQKALKDLTQSWMDRLQLISMITTFFASTEAGMLQITTPQAGSDGFIPTGWDNTTNAAFTGALAMHVNAAIISFLASFILIKYKVHVAKKEEKKAGGKGSDPSSPTNPDGNGDGNSEKAQQQPSSAKSSYGYDVAQYGYFSKNNEPPVHLLSRCHSLCIILSAVGFILAIIGIITFSWARQPQNVSIFTSVCMGVSALLLVILVWPRRGDEAIFHKD